MSHPQSQLTVFKLYQTVIDDVVNGIREAFLDEGVDEQVLQELRMLWESKLISTKAVDSTSENSGQGAVNNNSTGGNAASNVSQDTNGHTEKAPKPAPPSSASQSSQQPPAPPPVVLPADPNAQVPIQISMPKLSSDPPGFQRTITIHVPASCIHSNKLQDILSLPAIQATLSLPTEMAATALQGQINQALQQSSGLDLKAPPSGSQGFVQVDGQAADPSDDEEPSSSSALKATPVLPIMMPTTSAKHRGSKIYATDKGSASSSRISSSKGIIQVDGQTAGGGDSSEDEDEDDDDDDDLDDDADDRDDEREDEPEEEGQDEEPLNSDDDVSDAEGSSERLYDIENVVVCQFDKITRTRNKWKFHLKDGIMNLNGKDFVFQKATGDAEW